MTTPPVGVERRIGQRFPFNVPVSLRDLSTALEGLGFTQDLSSRGAFLFTDMALREGAEIELTLKMPSEITLGESMRVRCRGRVLRVVRPAGNGSEPATSPMADAKVSETNANELELQAAPPATSFEAPSEGTKIGVAVCLKSYEYLPHAEDGSADFRRISALHSPSESERNSAITPDSPRAAAH